MIPTVTKEQLKKALDLLNAELAKEEQNLKQAYRKAALKAHPDRGGEKEVFNVINAIAEAFINVADHGKKATRAEKLDLSDILNRLPKDTQDLIINKIIKQQPELTRKNLLDPVVYVVSTRYAYFANDPTEGRSHAFAVKAEKFEGLKEAFQDIKGDYLKTKILQDFRAQIENAGSKEELNDLKKQLKSSPEYAVLKSGQGLFTKITGIQTTSQKTFEAMFAEQEQNLNNSTPSMKA